VFAELVLDAALRFLNTEVPRWQRENHCYSCHNNGDGARALYLARQGGYAVPDAALAGTLSWLGRPQEWSRIKGAPAVGSANLARIQFAAALAEAWRAGATQDRALIDAAARELIAAQAADGSFPVDSGGMPGAPATYGTPLATVISRNTLAALDAKRYTGAIARADAWIAQAQPASLTDAAALLWGRGDRSDCRDRLLAAQTSDGGWGPQPKMPAEAFDTALAVLALRKAGAPAGVVARGRAFLIRMQDPDGAWPETTRPSGGTSYAERISTAGWVTCALLATAR
jgi:hypothetical protein